MKYYKLSRKNEIEYINPEKVPKEIYEHYEKHPHKNVDWEIPILEKDICYRFTSGKLDFMIVFRGYMLMKNISGISLQYVMELIRVLDNGINVNIPSDNLDRILYSELGMTCTYDPEANKTLFYLNLDANPVTVIKQYKNIKEIKTDLYEKNNSSLTETVTT
jgi:hypothetical protein